MSEDNPLEATVKKGRPPGSKIPKKITERYLYNAGLAYIQRFPSSSTHFRTIMGRRIERSCRHYPEQNREACYTLLDELIQKFIALGYINDRLYLGGMITSLRGRGLSTTAILMKLRQKGLQEEDIRLALSDYDANNGQNDELAALRLCRRKKIGPYAATSENDLQKQKWLAILARAGFSYEISARVLHVSPEDLEPL